MCAGAAARGKGWRWSAPLLLLAFGLGGCLPAPYGPYYRPAYPDASAQLEKAYCGGQAGPPATLRFRLPAGIEVTASALKRYEDRKRPDRLLRIALQVPPGVRFQFLSDTLEIAESPQGPGRKTATRLRANASLALAAGDWVDAAALGPLEGEEALRDATADGRHPATRVSLHIADFMGFAPEAVTLQLPAIQRGGGSTVLPPIELGVDKRFPDSWVWRAREYRENLIQRHARCLDETPQQACANILRYDADGIDTEAQGFAVTGRVWVWDVAKQTPFSADLKLAARSPERWRFATPEVRFTDPATRQLRVHRLETLRLHMDYSVPLATPVRGIFSSDLKGTALSLEASLGEKDAARYYIHLPAARIDGREHAIAPIELELRLFDGGIEPFNC